MKKHLILAINPGSTSTKLAIYENETLKSEFKISHDTQKILSYKHIIDQYEFRKEVILDFLKKEKVDLKSFSAIVGRGGMLKPIESGTYTVNELMINDMREAKRGEHASNLGCLLAKDLADIHHIPSYIVDPVAVDEMDDHYRYTGFPEIQRRSLFHALNHKAVARKRAHDLNKKYEDLNLIVAHLGGGISVAVHKQGKVIDVNNALDGDGPMSPERSGSVPMGPLYKMAFSGEYTLEEIKRKNYGKGGLVAYLGTNDGLEISKMIEEGNLKAKFIFEVMCYQIAKEIGSEATVLEGKVDEIILTGGLAYNKMLVDIIKKRVEFIAPVVVYAGENEMESLALGALRVLNGEEEAKIYS